MSEQIDGGPAFPETIAITPSGDVYPGFHGMTLLDWFAGQALVSCITQKPGKQQLMLDGKGYTDPTDIAAGLYRIANAMVAESAKAKGGEKESP